jgi:hypothetical protein
VAAPDSPRTDDVVGGFIRVVDQDVHQEPVHRPAVGALLLDILGCQHHEQIRHPVGGSRTVTRSSMALHLGRGAVDLVDGEQRTVEAGADAVRLVVDLGAGGPKAGS